MVTRRGARLLAVLLLVPAVLGDEYTHRYENDEAVRLWVNKVGPYNNPQETYNFHELPFCKKDEEAKPVHKWGGLGEVLEGNELIDSTLNIRFRTDLPKTQICEQTLDAKSAKKFKRAVKHHYW